MKRLTAAFATACLLAAAHPAGAAPAQVGNWLRGAQTGQTAGNVQPQRWVAWSPTANEDASPIIDVSACSSIDFLQSIDIAGSGAADCTAIHRIEMCPSGSDILNTDAKRNNACAQLPGTTDLSGDDSEANFSGVLVRVRGTAVGANFSQCRVILKCVGPSQ